MTLRRPNARPISGLPRIGPAVAVLYHHTVVPNSAVRIRGSAKSIPHEVDAEIRPIGGVIG